MTLNITAATYLGRSYSSSAVSTSATARTTDDVQGQADQNGSASLASTLSPVSISTLPLVQMPSDMLAAIQSGSGLHSPDPAKTAAQNAAPAYAVIKDADSGQILGGVWPNAAVVSKPNIPVDDRITANTDWEQVTQYLADDISQYTGKNITIQRFAPGDPDAPTFGSVMG